MAKFKTFLNDATAMNNTKKSVYNHNIDVYYCDGQYFLYIDIFNAE